MCGIGGVWYFDGRPARREELDAINRLQHHRGPDAGGTYRDEGLGLCHTRLAILDLSPAGQQPMADASGRFHITFNGEIYNFLELRLELEQLGAVFRTDSDTEVILAAYRQWGEDCQLRFNGMWAFAIWDSGQRRLFLSRDRFGVKPLHYHWSPGRFAFASEMKAFLAFDWFDPLFDAPTLSRALINSNTIEAAEDCLFHGLRRLCGGHSMTVEAGEAPRIRRWWSTLDHLPEVPAGREAQETSFRALFLDACRLRLRSDVAIATALSGGLDSSAVHGAVARLASSGGAPVERSVEELRTAFVASFPGSAFDERPYAEAVVSHAKSRGVFIELDPASELGNLDDILFCTEDLTTLTNAGWLLYREMSQRNIKVSLDGHGGDELLAAYHHYFQRSLALTDPPLPREELQAAYDGMFVPALHAVPPGSWPERRSFLRVEPGPTLYPGRKEDEERLARTDAITTMLYRDFHYLTLPTILRNFDRNSMAHGVEIRAPFLDWRIVCMAFALPLARKIGGGYSKRLIRTALGDLLPPQVRERKSKQGLSSPMHDWVLGPLRSFMMDILESRSFRESEVWDGPRIRKLMEEAASQGNGHLLNWGWDFIAAQRTSDMFRERRPIT